MSLLPFLAMGQAPSGGSQGGGNPLMGLVPFILIFVIFYFLIIRPQQQRQKKHQAMLSAIKKGDRILTSGGLYAVVLNVKDDKVVAEIASGIKVEIAKHAVSGLVSRTED